MTGKSVTITREELYRRLWETPLNQLVAELGTTYEDIRSIATRLNVPRPPSGYWNQKAAGRASLPPPLPEQPSEHPQSAEIDSRYEDRRIRAEKRTALEALVGRVTVPRRLSNPHPLVDAWKRRRLKDGRYANRQNNLAPAFFEPSETDHRRLCILQALLPALERQGAVLSGQYDEMPIEVRFAGASISFRLREKLKQIKRPPSEREKRLYGSFQSPVVTELWPTGILHFQIEIYTSVGQPSWIDSSKGQIEIWAKDIIVSILLARDCKLESIQRAEIEHARQQVLADQRRVERQKRELEEARWQAFVRLSNRSDEAEHLRRFLARLEAVALLPEQRYGDRSVAEWIEWARIRIEQIDPLARGGASLLEQLARIQASDLKDSM